MNATEFKKLISEEMQRREYQSKTITIYSRWISEVVRFHPNVEPDQLTIVHLRDFINHLGGRKHLSGDSINQAFHAFIFAFNDVLGKGFDFSVIRQPKRERSISDILSQLEVLRFIQSLSNLKHKIFFELTYSCGLDVSQAVRLKVADIDFVRERVKVRNQQGRTIRECVLSKFLAADVKSYLRETKATTWLFPGTNPSKHTAIRSMQTAFIRALPDLHIDKDISLKSLKYSYVKHLEQQGVPLISILDHLGLNNAHTLVFYSKLGPVDGSVNHSPLDRILSTDQDQKINLDALERMLRNVVDEDERDYLKESIVCLGAGALRAGIIFAWSAAVRNIQKKCFSHSVNSINLSLKRHYPKAHEIKVFEDLARIDDALLLLLAVDLVVFDKNEKDILEKGCLDLRNKCGHPGKYRPKPFRAAAFLEDLITIVFK